MNTDASLSIAIGCMFAGKTTWLIGKYYSNQEKGRKCYPINYVEDKRYSDKLMSTHDKQMIECFQTNHVMNLLTEKVLNEYDVFLINEAQFFSDLICAVQKFLIPSKFQEGGNEVTICLRIINGR